MASPDGQIGVRPATKALDSARFDGAEFRQPSSAEVPRAVLRRVMGAVIAGTGAYVPDTVATNADLGLLMDTSDEWIRSRTGVEERRIAANGMGSSDLGSRAARTAIEDAGLQPSDIDALIVATMTPDYYAPGCAPLVQQKLGLGAVPTYEIHQQCTGFLYGLDLADSLIASGRADRVVLVGAEVHTMFMPWADQIGPLLELGVEPTPEEFAHNSRFREWSVLFGDGAAAAVLAAGSDPDAGWRGAILRSDGHLFELIHVPGLGSKSRPYVDAADIAKGVHMPTMNGGQLFRNAVRLMPQVMTELLERHGLETQDLRFALAHQANGRIVEAVRRSLGLPPEQVPVNLNRYGNTTAATLGLLYHELRQDGLTSPGDLLGFVAFGAGAHWGAGLYREA